MLTVQQPKLGCMNLSSEIELSYYSLYNHQGYHRPDLIAAVLSQSEVPIPDLSLDTLLSGRVDKVWAPTPIPGLKPLRFTRETQVPTTFMRRFRDTWSLLTGKWDQFSRPSKSAGENPVKHTNIVGNVCVGALKDSRYSKTVVMNHESLEDYNSIWSEAETLYVEHELLYRDGKVSRPTDPGLLELNSPLTYFVDENSLVDLRERVAQGHFDVYWPGLRGDFFRDFRFEYHHGVPHISYIWVISSDSWPHYWWDVVYVHHSLTYKYGRVQAPIGEAFSVDSLVDVTYSTYYGGVLENLAYDAHFPNCIDALPDVLQMAEDTVPFDLYWPFRSANFQGSWFDGPRLNVGKTFLLGDIINTGIYKLIGYDTETMQFVKSHDLTLLAFEEFCEQKFPRYVAGTAVSSIDAVDDHFGSLSKADHIETLSELDDILSPIDVGKAAFMILRGKRKGLRYLLDTLADAKLTYSFALAPTYDDALAVSRNLRSFLRKLNNQNLYGSHTIYGKSSYVLEGDTTGQFGRLSIVCRSKIRVSTNIDTLLPYILPYRSLGLLPSLSTAWNLIPLSFVADWLTRTGSSTKLLEDQAMLMLLNHEYSVNSISVYYNFDEVSAASYGFIARSSGDGSPGYKFYVRYVVNDIPIIGPTDLPIIGNVGVPDFGTAAALMWKILL